MTSNPDIPSSDPSNSIARINNTFYGPDIDWVNFLSSPQTESKYGSPSWYWNPQTIITSIDSKEDEDIDVDKVKLESIHRKTSASWNTAELSDMDGDSIFESILLEEHGSGYVYSGEFVSGSENVDAMATITKYPDWYNRFPKESLETFTLEDKDNIFGYDSINGATCGNFTLDAGLSIEEIYNNLSSGNVDAFTPGPQ